MAKSKETFNKKEKEKKRKEKQNAKAQRKEERQMNAVKGAGLEDMMAYVDEFGNLTSVPTDYKNKKETNLEDIQISVPTLEEREQQTVTNKGKVTYFNTEKGFGFIKDQMTGQDVFVHVNSLVHSVEINDRVSFEMIRGKKGPEAINVVKL